MVNRIPIVLLVGSSEFEDTFDGFAETLKASGKKVINIGGIPDTDDKIKEYGIQYTSHMMAAFLNCAKSADEVLVININRYIGPNTNAIIESAKTHLCDITYACWKDNPYIPLT